MEKPPISEKSAPVAAPAKKPYHPPQFSVYGKVREITKSVTIGSMNDTAIHGNDKTSV